MFWTSLLMRFSEKTKRSGKGDSAVDVEAASHIRHLNLISRGDVEAAFPAVDARKLRTVSQWLMLIALPESITKLYHLETLRFTDCKSLEKLPQKVRNLVSLRHLHFDDPKLVPTEVRLLTRLQTLPIFAVGPDHMVEELGCLKETKRSTEDMQA
uniref:Disease resistance R13L4/SHOC-2-like LRR domain-containing protein n=1 Tax=Populus alba TaxID=43335 RepID=A0A4U5M4D3_POPAL|nr:hypothetical protein D5086_0000323420 [Populus alba]